MIGRLLKLLRPGKAGSNAQEAPWPEARGFPGQAPQQPAKSSEGAATPRQQSRRARLIRKETGTHETLTIVDDSAAESDDDMSSDPYNSGSFDRSKNWERRFR